MADHVDVAVIGSGFGGAITAFRYAAAGLRVMVLERGLRIPDADLRQSQAPDDLFRVYTRYQSTFLGGGGDDTGLDVLTGTVVGGGSIVYSGVSLRAPSFVFDRVGGDGEPLWPSGITRSSLDPFYETVEQNLPVTQMVWRTDDPEEAWRQVPRRGSAWAEVMGAAGHTVLPIRQAVQDCVHCGWCNAGCRFGAKRDVTKSYLPAAEALGAVLRSGMEVRALDRVADRWQVLGVQRTGPGPADVGPETVLVDADHVVLAGGTVASTLLLQASGVTSNPHLGKHVSGNADLPIAAFLAQPTDGYQGVAMDTVSFDFLRPETTGPHAADKFIIVSQHMLPLSTLVCGHGGAGPPDAWGLERKHRYADFGRHFIGLAVIGLDEQEGTIEGPEVHASDGVRLLPLRYPVAPNTQAVWDRAKQVCRDAVEASGGTFVDLARELANPQTAHPLGGARMATDAANGVVDADGFVHGVDGLSVLDGAFVPSAVGVNPSLTIAALVERAMAKRVTDLGRPDAAALRPSDVLEQGPSASSPSQPAPAANGGTLPATGHQRRLLPVVAGRRRVDRGGPDRKSCSTPPRGRPMTVRRAVTLAALLLLAFSAAPARAQSPEPYRDPPFTCTVHDYGTDPPELPAPADDPLCVRYDKTNITVSTLGIVDFLVAEPGRVAIVAAKCSYWQQDHWVIRASPDTPPLVSWEGSYWYDAPTGAAAGILRNLRVGDQPTDAATFVEALRPLIGDAATDELSLYADDGGGGGATFALPEGFGGDPCAASADPPAPGDGGEPSTPQPLADGGSVGAGEESKALPTTGTGLPVWLGLLLLLLAGAVCRVERAVR